MFFIGCDNLRDCGALADDIIMSGRFDVCDVWQIRFWIEGVRPWSFYSW